MVGGDNMFGYGGFHSSSAVVLVLFILLVIIVCGFGVC